MIAIIGAGLAGLSAAYRLSERGVDYVLYEKAPMVGGYCRSYKKNNHTFDLAGHFLHLRSDEGKKLIEKIKLSGMAKRERKAAILTQGKKVPYPFQAHLGFLEAEPAAECLSGYVNALLKTKKRKENTFGKWLLSRFGAGMYRHFFKPYNEKFWKLDLDDILLDWTSWSVPTPNADEVIRGAMRLENKGMGYNPTFLYPEEGGAGAIANVLAKKLKGLTTEAGVKEIQAKKKELMLYSGEIVKYDVLINTIPLPNLFEKIQDAPAALKRAAKRLRWINIDCAQLAFKRENVIEEDWVYVPDENVPFYRVGKYPGGAGETGTALFVEFTRKKGDPAPKDDALIGAAIKGLADLGIISAKEKPELAETVALDPAYVVYDKHRNWFLPRAQVYLERMGIHSIGRYGAWEYSTMEDALLAGKRVAENLA